ncbi:MAG: GntR family transcriptional regulator, partial [Halomonas sp.]
TWKEDVEAAVLSGGGSSATAEALRNGNAEGARSAVVKHLDSLLNLLDLSPRDTEADLKAIFGAATADA